MAHECSVCGKRPQMGNRVEIRGKAKYLGGVGTKVTGISRRQFKPNLQKVKVALALARGKKLHDKRESLKQKDIKREMQRAVSRS